MAVKATFKWDLGSNKNTFELISNVRIAFEIAIFSIFCQEK